VYLTDSSLSVQGGVLISFANMQNVSYDLEKDTIMLQPGVRWKDAISALEPYGVAPLGGRVGLVTEFSKYNF
jgi:FAD/FMN-containing dehydrogenase